MDKKLLARFEETVIGLREKMQLCDEAVLAVSGGCRENRIAILPEIEKAKEALAECDSLIRSCGELYEQLTGEEFACETYEEALSDVEKLKARKLRETAEEFLDIRTDNESISGELADAKEILQVLAESAKSGDISEEDEASLANYALFVEKYKCIADLTSKERYNLMQSLSPLLGEDLVIAAFMDKELYGLAAEKETEQETEGAADTTGKESGEFTFEDEEGAAGTTGKESGEFTFEDEESAAGTTGKESGEFSFEDEEGAAGTTGKESEEFSFEDETGDGEDGSGDEGAEEEETFVFDDDADEDVDEDMDDEPSITWEDKEVSLW